MKDKEILGFYISSGKLDVEKLINEYYNYIYLVIKNMSSIAITEEDIEEILSDTFLAIWKNADRLNKTTNIKAYLMGAAKNITRNKYRDTVMNFSIADYEDKLCDTLMLETSIEEKERMNVLKNLVNTFDSVEHDIFIMFYYDDLKIKEIAKILNLSTGNVKVKLHRIRKEIKNRLKNGGYGYEE